MGVFSGLRKKLSDKDYKKMFDALDAAEQECHAWGLEAEKFLNGGKLPSKTAADIDKIIADSEKLALENQKKLKPKDSGYNDLSVALAGVQKLKIDHRKHVGTLLANFESLDASGATEVSKAATTAMRTVEETKSAAETAMEQVVAIVQQGKKDAYEQILKKGGYVHSQRKYTEDTGHLLGRTVKSSIDYNEFKAAHDRVNGDLGKLQSSLELVVKMIKKL